MWISPAQGSIVCLQGSASLAFGNLYTPCFGTRIWSREMEPPESSPPLHFTPGSTPDESEHKLNTATPLVTLQLTCFGVGCYENVRIVKLHSNGLGNHVRVVLGPVTWCTLHVYCSYFSGFFIERKRIVCTYISNQLQLTMLNKIIQFHGLNSFISGS